MEPENHAEAYAEIPVYVAVGSPDLVREVGALAVLVPDGMTETLVLAHALRAIADNLDRQTADAGMPLARIAFAAYGSTVRWRNPAGGWMRPWEQMPELTREGWRVAAAAVAAAVRTGEHP